MGFKPLYKLRVLDLTRALSGPFCAMILGDLGADVIKVEPLAGEMTRSYPPHASDGSSTYFLSANRSKRSIALDFRSDEGLGILRRLVDQADILIENFRPGVMDNIGLGHSAIVGRNPKIIFASISGFGKGGPYEEWPGFDQIAQGMSGLMSVIGTEETGPLRVGIPITDLAAGMWTAIGILAAVVDRGRSASGRKVDVSLLGGALGLMTVQAQRYLSAGEVPAPGGNDHAMVAPYGVFEASDGKFSIGAGTQAMWISVCKVLGRADLLSRAEFATIASRVKHKTELKAELNSVLRTRDRLHWTKMLIDAGVPAGPIWNLDEVFADEHVASSGRVVDIDHPTIGKLRQVAVPISYDGAIGIADYRSPPLLGQHTIEILTEYGMTAAEIEKAIGSGAILQHGRASAIGQAG